VRNIRCESGRGDTFSEALAHVNILFRSGRRRIAKTTHGLALEAA
jgi:hypothetical protein